MDKNQLMTSTVLKNRVKSRFYRALDYLSIYLFILIVYGGAIIIYYLLFSLIGQFLDQSFSKYPIVSLIVDHAFPLLGLFFISSAIVHKSLLLYHAKVAR